METTDCLKIAATGLAGLFAGAAFYCNAAEHPARMTLDDTKSCRKQWAGSFHRAKKFQSSMAVASAGSAATVYYLDTESDSRLLWLAGSGLILTIVPWTLVVMLPDINKNLKDDVMTTAGETWVRNHIDRWNKQHAVRTLLGCSAFGVFLYAMTKK